MSEKIKTHHLKRKAMLYIRQSSLQQVVRNEESRRLQYSMEARIRQLGWTEVEVIDEDLGRSASGTAERSGFERMVAEVCLGNVGAVAAREVSRFARNSREWQQLVEVCRMVDTLLVDHETIYNPRLGNDRLLLGLKGSLNEYELDILRLRSVEARLEKARRGELVVAVPVGYVRTADQEIVKDPDRRVQKSLNLVFRKFFELGTVRQVMLWFLEHDLELPVRIHSQAGWEIRWKRPTYHLVRKILGHPFYAGAYAYGRTEATVEFEGGKPRKRIRRRPVENWISLIYDHHEGYIDREQFERIQAMISKNSNNWNLAGSGAAKHGVALLTGLLRCRRCGRRLMVSYSGREGNVQRYICCRGFLNHAEPRCISLGGAPVDAAISRELLRVVEPGAMEAARKAGHEAKRGGEEVTETLALELQAAQYAAERAWKQYDAVDPENRLVVDELERRWNVALEKVKELEDRIERESRDLEGNSPPGPEVFEELASDFDRVWNDPKTDSRLKKRIARTLIEEVIVDVDRQAGEVSLIIHWKGGVHTELRVPCRRRGQNSLHTAPEIVDVVRSLVAICPDDVIAGVLNRNGLRTGRGNRWTRERVASLRSKRRIVTYSPKRQKAEGWMTLTQAAEYLDVVPVTLRKAAEKGDVEAMHPLPEGPWLFKRENLDGPGRKKLVERIRKHRERGAKRDPGQLSLLKPRT